MHSMFSNASVFNQNISGWCVTNIKSEPMYFRENSALSPIDTPVWRRCPKTSITDANFSQAIETCLSTNPVDGMCSDSKYGAMPDWNVSQVKDMALAFLNKIKFNANISAWDTGNVTNMSNILSGVDDQNQLDISIYPNPTSDMLNIDGNYTQLKVVIYNVLGKEILNKSIINNIDISHLDNGVYILQLLDGLKLITRKIIKN